MSLKFAWTLVLTQTVDGKKYQIYFAPATDDYLVLAIDFIRFVANKPHTFLAAPKNWVWV